MGEPEGKGPPLGRPRHRWVDDIKMDLKEIGWEDVGLFYLGKDRDQWAVMNMAMNPQVLYE
jgi:hypothetical protein